MEEMLNDEDTYDVDEILDEAAMKIVDNAVTVPTRLVESSTIPDPVDVEVPFQG